MFLIISDLRKSLGGFLNINAPPFTVVHRDSPVTLQHFKLELEAARVQLLGKLKGVRVAGDPPAATMTVLSRFADRMMVSWLNRLSSSAEAKSTA